MTGFLKKAVENFTESRDRLVVSELGISKQTLYHFIQTRGIVPGP